jgi:hypothetical protein
MKWNLGSTALGIVLFAALVSAAPAAQAQGCAMSDVVGKWGYTSSGTIVTPPVGAFAAVGHLTFSAMGTFSGAQTTSIAGNFFDETITGTYTVNPDCTGTIIANVYHGTTLVRTTSLKTVFVDNQREARSIFVTSGTAITINARKILSRAED